MKPSQIKPADLSRLRLQSGHRQINSNTLQKVSTAPMQSVTELHPWRSQGELTAAPFSCPSSVLINVNFIVLVPGRCSPRMCVRTEWHSEYTGRHQTAAFDKAVFRNFHFFISLFLIGGGMALVNFYPCGLLTLTIPQKKVRLGWSVEHKDVTGM